MRNRIRQNRNAAGLLSPIADAAGTRGPSTWAAADRIGGATIVISTRANETEFRMANALPIMMCSCGMPYGTNVAVASLLYNHCLRRDR